MELNLSVKPLWLLLLKKKGKTFCVDYGLHRSNGNDDETKTKIIDDPYENV